MRKEKILLIFTLFFVFLFVYSPHFDYGYPFHIDEWHHIEYSMKLFNKSYPIDLMEAGADFILFLISRSVDIVKFAQFLPEGNIKLLSDILPLHIRNTGCFRFSKNVILVFEIV